MSAENSPTSQHSNAAQADAWRRLWERLLASHVQSNAELKGTDKHRESEISNCELSGEADSEKEVVK
ncbi:MAG: hypothetical protein M3362_02825 [Acidobacteriota bacterium]|nr:hypothetical protein [Acidobacteriota bacterium]